jgi:hypothetical protein
MGAYVLKINSYMDLINSSLIKMCSADCAFEFNYIFTPAVAIGVLIITGINNQEVAGK